MSRSLSYPPIYRSWNLGFEIEGEKESGRFSPCDREAEQRSFPLHSKEARHTFAPPPLDLPLGRGTKRGTRSCVVPKSSRTRHTSAATRPVHTPASGARFATPSNLSRVRFARVIHATANLLGKPRHVNAINFQPTIIVASFHVIPFSSFHT